MSAIRGASRHANQYDFSVDMLADSRRRDISVKYNRVERNQQNSSSHSTGVDGGLARDENFFHTAFDIRNYRARSPDLEYEARRFPLRIVDHLVRHSEPPGIDPEFFVEHSLRMFGLVRDENPTYRLE